MRHGKPTGVDGVFDLVDGSAGNVTRKTKLPSYLLVFSSGQSFLQR
jgi:hypothetical protein